MDILDNIQDLGRIKATLGLKIKEYTPYTFAVSQGKFLRMLKSEMRQFDSVQFYLNLGLKKELDIDPADELEYFRGIVLDKVLFVLISEQRIAQANELLLAMGPVAFTIAAASGIKKLFYGGQING